MKWPWSRKAHPCASPEAIESIKRGQEELREARRLRSEASSIGASLEHSRDVNHYAMALAAIFRGEVPR